MQADDMQAGEKSGSETVRAILMECGMTSPLKHDFAVYLITSDGNAQRASEILESIARMWYHINEIKLRLQTVTVSLDITIMQGEMLYMALMWMFTKSADEISEFNATPKKEGVAIYKLLQDVYDGEAGAYVA